jgi:hypothetical protein
MGGWNIKLLIAVSSFGESLRLASLTTLAEACLTRSVLDLTGL